MERRDSGRGRLPRAEAVASENRGNASFTPVSNDAIGLPISSGKLTAPWRLFDTISDYLSFRHIHVAERPFHWRPGEMMELVCSIILKARVPKMKIRHVSWIISILRKVENEIQMAFYLDDNGVFARWNITRPCILGRRWLGRARRSRWQQGRATAHGQLQ